MIELTAMIVAGGIAMGADGTSETGTTTIARWRDGKASAVTLAFDDSLWSHVDYVIPLLARNGLVGSFWVNPATSRYGYGIEMWEGGAQALGMEMYCLLAYIKLHPAQHQLPMGIGNSCEMNRRPVLEVRYLKRYLRSRENCRWMGK